MTKWSSFFADVLESTSSICQSTFDEEKFSELPFPFESGICLHSEIGELNLEKEKKIPISSKPLQALWTDFSDIVVLFVNGIYIIFQQLSHVEGSVGSE